MRTPFQKTNLKVFTPAWLLLLFLLSVQLAGGQSTWTGNAGDGLWTDANNWSPASVPAANSVVQFNNGGTYTVTAVPAITLNQLLVTNSTNVTLSVSVAAAVTINGSASTANLNIASGSTLQIGGTAVLTLTFATTASQIATIAGNLLINADGTFSSGIATTTVNVTGIVNLTGATSTYTATNTATTVTGALTNSGAGTITATAANLTIGAGGFYNHAINAGTIPTATWNSTSTCNVTGSTATAPAGMVQTFGNFIWNCTGQTAAMQVAPAGQASYTMTSGNFTVSSTGSTYLTLISTATSTPTLTITGNLYVTGGTLYIQTSTDAVTVGVQDCDVSGGIFYLNGSSATDILNVNGNLTTSNTGILNFSSSGGTNTLNAFGNITNNGTINSSVANSLLVMKGTTATPQVISGTGTWTGGVANCLEALTINNTGTGGVELNTNLTIGGGANAAALNLTAGVLGGTGTLTLGAGVTNVLTTTVTAATISPSLSVAYNLTNVTYNITYSNGATSYTTGQEIPSFTTNMAQIAAPGTLTVSNGSTVVLGANGTVGSLAIGSGTPTANTIFRLNGYNLRVSGNFQNFAAVPPTNSPAGLDASGSGSTLTFIGNSTFGGPQLIEFGNQTFNGVITTPNVVVNNTYVGFGAEVAYYLPNGAATSAATWNINNLTVNSGSFFQIGYNTSSYYYTVNVAGNIVNNGTIFAYNANAATYNMIMMGGTTQQTISGTGTWNQTGTNPETGVFPGFGINNTSSASPQVILNQSFAVDNVLLLITGTIGGTGVSGGGTGTLTLGVGQVQTMYTYVGTPGAAINGFTYTGTGGILPVSSAAYNMANMTYDIYYGNGSTAYSTAGEVPSGTLTESQSPTAGYMYMFNNGLIYSTVVLGNNGTVPAVQMYNDANSILRLNGKTLQLSNSSNGQETVLNAAGSANTMGLDATVSGSTLSFIGTGAQYIYFGNQTFSSVVTAPNVIVSNTNSAAGADAYLDYAGVADNNGVWYINNLTVNSGSYFAVGAYNTTYYVTANVAGNIINNGTIMAYGTSAAGTSDMIMMAGTSQQTISGSGTWTQITANAGTNVFPSLGINNTSATTPQLVLNQSFALSSGLLLVAGTIGGTGVTGGGSGTLTLGNGASGNTFTTYVATVTLAFNGLANPSYTSTTGGGFLPVSCAAYNLANMGYNLYYGNGATAYTTQGEVPPATLTVAQAPTSGYMYMTSNGAATIFSTVILGNNGTVPAIQIYNDANSILRLNGKTLQLSNTSNGQETVLNAAGSANTMGLDATVSGSTLTFIGDGNQYIYFGNQTFSSVVTAPNVIVSNTNSTTGADVYLDYAGVADNNGVWYINNLTVNSGSYFAVGAYNTTYYVTANVAGNIVNNGTIMAYGTSAAGTSDMIMMAGTSQQTISGSGTWSQITSNTGTNVFPSLGINNTSATTPQLVLNQSFALSSGLLLVAGTIGGNGVTGGGSGTLTLGNGVSGNTFTTYVATITLGFNGLANPSYTSSTGGGFMPVSCAAYNLGGMVYNILYGNGATAYTTQGEVPPATLTVAQAPTSGYMYMTSNGATTIFSTVILGNNGTVPAIQIYNDANSILRLNGKTLQLSNTSNGQETVLNAAGSANTMGLDATVSGSTLTFIGDGNQYIYFGNQTFSSVVTAPNVIVSNTNSTTGADVYLDYAGVADNNGVWYINNLTVNSGSYFAVGAYNTTYYVTANVAGNIVNNGTIMAYGTSAAGTSDMIMMAGTSQQTISGSGTWSQITSNTGTNVFPSLGINNTSATTPQLVLNQSFALSSGLLLVAGTIGGNGVTGGGSGTLTLGNGVSGNTFTTYVATITLGFNGLANPSYTSSTGGGFMPVSCAAYNLGGMVYNILYGNGATAYTTQGEVPPATLTVAQAPTSGYMYMTSNGATTIFSTVILGNNGTVPAIQIYNDANSILRLNGKTLQLSNTSNGQETVLNAAGSANTMGLDATVSGSTLTFIGNGNQYIYFGNQTFNNIVTAPNVVVSNTNSTTGADVYLDYAGVADNNGAWYINNLTVNSGGYFTIGYSTSYSNTVDVAGNIVDNGTIQAYGSATYNNAIEMNGTAQQTISGTGTFAQTTANPGTGIFTAFGINNTSATSPQVLLNMNLAVANYLLLGNGTLGTSNGSTLTIGIGTGTMQTQVANGVLGMTPVFNLNGSTYNVTYNASTSWGNGNPAFPTTGTITTGRELPPLSYPNYELGLVTISNTVGSGVVLGRSANINTMQINGSTAFNMNGDTLGVYGSTGIYIVSGATMYANSTGSTIILNGTAAQTLFNASSSNTLVDNTIYNLTVNNPAGATLNIFSLTIPGTFNLESPAPSSSVGTATFTGGLTYTLNGTVTGTGTLASGGTSNLILGGTGNMGTIYLEGTGQTFANFTSNITGTSPQITFNGNLGIGTLFTLTSGVVNMSSGTVTYTSATTTPMLTSNAASYFSFLGLSSGFQWSMPASLAAGTYKWPIGPAGTVSGFRPVIMQTTVANPASVVGVKIGFINAQDGSGLYTATDIPEVSPNNMAEYIANLTVSGAGFTTAPGITMEYQNGDFYGGNPSLNNANTYYLNIYYYNQPSSGTAQWTNTTGMPPGTVTNAPPPSYGSDGSNNTVVKTTALALSTAGTYPLNLAAENADPGTAVNNTWIWTGSSSTVWNLAGNWNPASIPPTGANIIIPATTNQPVINATASPSVNNITIESGAYLTISGAFSLTVAGTFTNNNYNGTNNGLTCTSTATVIYTGSNQLIAPGNYYNLTNSGTGTSVLSPVGTIAIANLFTPGSGAYTYTGSTINFNGTTAQTGANAVPAFNWSQF